MYYHVEVAVGEMVAVVEAMELRGLFTSDELDSSSYMGSAVQCAPLNSHRKLRSMKASTSLQGGSPLSLPQHWRDDVDGSSGSGGNQAKLSFASEELLGSSAFQVQLYSSYAPLNSQRKLHGMLASSSLCKNSFSPPWCGRDDVDGGSSRGGSNGAKRTFASVELLGFCSDLGSAVQYAPLIPQGSLVCWHLVPFKGTHSVYPWKRWHWWLRCLLHQGSYLVPPVV
jgi:hypothetical protein